MTRNMTPGAERPPLGPARAMRLVRGYCPACGSESLLLGSEGDLVCDRSDCPRPSAAAEILADHETDHIVEIRDTDFTVLHPLRERLDGQLLACDLHQCIRDLAEPFTVPGRYRVSCMNGGWVWDVTPVEGGS